VTDVECLIYYKAKTFCVAVITPNIPDVFYGPSLLQGATTMTLLQGCRESRKHMFTVVAVAVEGCRRPARAMKAGHVVLEASRDGSVRNHAELERKPPLNECQPLFPYDCIPDGRLGLCGCLKQKTGQMGCRST
jgi:hypothetical protein